MGPADVLQPVLAAVGDNSKDPRIEATAHLGEVLVRLDERELQYVFRDIRTASHAKRVSVQRITVTRYQHAKRVAAAGQDALNNQLIGVLIGPRRAGLALRHLHDGRVMPIPRTG